MSGDRSARLSADKPSKTGWLNTSLTGRPFCSLVPPTVTILKQYNILPIPVSTHLGYIHPVCGTLKEVKWQAMKACESTSPGEFASSEPGTAKPDYRRNNWPQKSKSEQTQSHVGKPERTNPPWTILKISAGR